MMVIGINLLVVVGISALVLSSSAETMHSQAVYNINEHTQALANTVDSRLERVSSVTRTLAAALGHREASPVSLLWQSASAILTQPDNLIVRINSFTPLRQGYRAVVFNRPNKPSSVAPMATYIMEQPPQDAWFLRALERERTFWHGPDRAFFAARSQRVFSVAARSSSGSGVVWSDIPASQIDGWMQEALRGDFQGGYNILIDAQGNILSVYSDVNSDPRFSQEVSQSAAVQALLASTLRTGSGMVESMDPLRPDEPAIIVWSVMPGTGWRLVRVLSVELVDVALERSILRAFALIVTGMTILGVLIYYFADRNLTQPLNSLTNAAQNIGSGDMRYQISYQDRRDEIGRMARVLEDMKYNLSHSYRELSLWSHVLERRVTERTHELEIARREAQTTAAELRTVYDASLSVVNEYQLEALLQALIERIPALLQTSYCGVWLLTSDEQHLQLVATSSPDKSMVNMTITLQEGLVGETVRALHPMIMEDYANWPGKLAHHQDNAIARAMAVPLIFYAQPIGALLVGRAAGTEAFDENDQRLLVLLANLVSPVVRNAQLYVQREEAMKQAERASEVKTRFLAAITHELRTPLNLIINNMDFMRIGAFGDVSAEQSDRLDQTIRSAEHLLYLINDLLDVSKIEAGEMQLFIQPSDVYPVIEDALDSTMMLVERNPQLVLTVDIAENLPLVPMDARRVRQVLSNLLSNAIKFTPEGEVHLETKLFDDYIEFSVTDSGIGIPADEMSKLFEPFERTNRAKQLGIEGTGLGLPISRYLVEAHKGTMSVVTEVGRGSRFSFTLPLQQPETDSEGKRVKAIMTYH